MDDVSAKRSIRELFINLLRDLGIEQPEVLSRFVMRHLYGAYLAGARKALQDYAYSKDGVQYVGTGGKTLEQAVKDLEKEMGDSGTWELPSTEWEGMTIKNPGEQ